ncbi:PREDICTED: uncharacterized protein LOC109580481 [Amphimedon queenslandica]|uniref:Aspartyl/asparaginy/proline hydroxylase domain-containing protein n=1 Tax=Amphimedon queenslandica TaxID=400682 RepID=A0A1X7VXF9_AMPQE|nr:PREDICTED: uncharacterized protein LOC109580481 [Amphimedon queenslandica]|eukprot:XP_019849262.1 PREDICTED: uncharacterized protein LOC109580481 [Amphimedon queenslandica]
MSLITSPRRYSLLLHSLVLSLLLSYSSVHVDGKKEKETLHRLPITGQADLVFKVGDNPCKVLKKYCKSLQPRFTYETCFSQLHPVAIQQLSQLWEKVRERLKVDETFFIDCEPIKYIGSSNGFSPGISVTAAPTTLNNGGSTATDTRNSSGIISEMLTYLKRAMAMDADALQTFNTRRNELKLTDSERYELYRKALLLLPNNLFVVDQFGLALMYIDYEAPARKLFSNAVSRGMWGNPLQRPVSKYVPGLTSLPWHDKTNYPFITRLESGYQDIKDELLSNLKERRHLFTEEAENLHVGGDWTELRLKSSGLGFLKHTEYFPKTMRHIENCGQDFTSIKFSAIQPGTHIRTHTGPTNERLRVHLTLIHNGGARIRVGTEWHTWEEGKAIIFDDSWEHEVIHTGDSIRAVLILDIWHPELPPSQRIVH